ncbi:MAG TPA: Hint domain-containing protein, partial [Myxococcaceae bacterium]|nr:Hint domain-containing protein [Myxococcaceae bacterium]
QQEADKQTLAADSLHMAKLFSRWSQVQAQSGRAAQAREMPVDLSDEAQYRFVLNRVRASGSTPENSPQLFRRIEELRRSLPARPDTPRLQASSVTAEGTPRERCGQILGLSSERSDSAEKARFEAMSLVTCFDGSDYAFTDVTAFATNAEQTSFRLLASQAVEDYAVGTLETPPLDLALQTNPDELLVVDSVAMAFNEATGESYMSYTLEQSSVVSLGMQGPGRPYELTASFDHPRELIGAHLENDPVIGGNPIRTCLERGAVTGYLDCDYASGSKDPVTGEFRPFSKPYTGVAGVDPEKSLATWQWHPWKWDDKEAYWEPAGGYDGTHLYLPLEGQYETTLPRGYRIEEVESNASLILMERGGRCLAGTNPGTNVAWGNLPFLPHYSDPEDSTRKIIPFKGLGDFGKDCLDSMQNTKLYVRTSLKVIGGPILNLNPPVRYLSDIKSIYNLDWRNLCLAEGTQVLKADGTTVAVEEVQVGDKLLANGSGLALTVTTLSRGGERKPLVKLKDEAGHEVMVTETHPMVAKRGVVQARELKVGDVVLARDGARTLEKVERVPYDGQ